MKKIVFTLAACLLALTSITGQQWLEEPNPYASNAEDRIEFKKGKYTRLYTYVAGYEEVTCTGKFTRKRNKVILAKGTYNEEIASKDQSKVPCGQTTCTFEDVTDSIYVQKSLRCPKKAYYMPNNVPFGQRRVVNNHQVVVTQHKQVKATTTLRMRSGPGTSFSKFSLECDVNAGNKEGDEGYNVLPKGYADLITLARTLKKTKVGKHNDYWYYMARPVQGQACSGEFFWLYGAFLK